MSKSKYKLSGYAIKGDGTQQTAERIRKVFEADGINCCDWCFEFDQYYGVDGDTAVPAGKYLRVHKLIPLAEAERIVFGDELKVGMKVVSGKCNVEGMFKAEDRIGEIVQTSHYQDGYDYKLKFSIPNEKDLEVWCSVKRRATITDFLRTLPEDIAERALRQVDEDSEYYTLYPEDLAAAVAAMGKWDDKAEGYQYWNEVAHGNYDRAGAILGEKDRIGKWWKHENGAIFYCTKQKDNGDMQGYGVSFSGDWFEDNDQPACTHQRAKDGLTPATPEEVEAVLVKEAKKRGFVSGAKIDNSSLGFYFNGVLDFCDNLYWNRCGNHYLDIGGDVRALAIFKDGKWAEIITPAPEKPQPTDKFPRVMWVGDYVKEMEPKMVESHVKQHSYPWKTASEDYRYASDTHPVTGEPAVKKDVVEQIREVVECELTPEIDMVRQIKEILKNEK